MSTEFRKGRLLPVGDVGKTSWVKWYFNWIKSQREELRLCEKVGNNFLDRDKV